MSSFLSEVDLDRTLERAILTAAAGHPVGAQVRAEMLRQHADRYTIDPPTGQVLLAVADAIAYTATALAADALDVKDYPTLRDLRDHTRGTP